MARKARKLRTEFEVGDKIHYSINDSVRARTIPCSRPECAHGIGTTDGLTAVCGRHDFDIRANNTGLKFRLGEWRYQAAFLPRSYTHLITLDDTFKRVKDHAHTTKEAKVIARTAFEKAKRAKLSDRDAEKAAKTAYTEARRGLSKEAAIEVARATLPDVKDCYVVIVKKSRIGAPPTAEDRKRLDDITEDNRKGGFSRVRWTPERRISV